MVIILAESEAGRLKRATLEAITAARQLDDTVSVIIAGFDTAAVAAELSQYGVADVIRLEHPDLDSSRPETMVSALAAALTGFEASHVVCAHTYQARDYVPRLAARLNRPLLTDCSGIERAADTIVFHRPVFQGKVTADVVLDGPPPHFVSVQIGAFRSVERAAQGSAAPIRRIDAEGLDSTVRPTAEPPFRETRQEINLAEAERIVAVGRGFKEESQLTIVHRLAAALGAEVAASRPVCDVGWLPMDRQIGSSGQTVAPRLYVALGISGAIQHIVGMKGSQTIVAVNRDPDAPIFEIADFGLVGDLAEVVPALLAALEVN